MMLFFTVVHFRLLSACQYRMKNLEDKKATTYDGSVPQVVTCLIVLTG